MLLSVNLKAQFHRLDSASLSMIDSFIVAEMDSELMVGLSVGIIRNGEIAFLDGFGFADLDDQIAASENTTYRLASISKVITGLLSMQLVESGDLLLDDDIRDHVPEYPIKAEGIITSEELLSHESGIQHYGTYNTAA